MGQKAPLRPLKRVLSGLLEQALPNKWPRSRHSELPTVAEASSSALSCTEPEPVNISSVVAWAVAG
jgi:hypothetical protein